MSTLRAYIGVAGLTDIGYRLYTQNTPVAARQTAGVTDEGSGWYSVAGVTLAGDHVRWDSAGDASISAREDLSMRILLDAIKNKTDLLTSGAVTVVSPVSLTGNIITVRAADSWSIQIAALGNLTGITKLWFAVNTPGAADSAAKLFIEKTAGLTIINGSTVGVISGNGSITIIDSSAGNVTIAVDEVVTALLSGQSNWAIKERDASGDDITLATGVFNIVKPGVSTTQ